MCVCVLPDHQDMMAQSVDALISFHLFRFHKLFNYPLFVGVKKVGGKEVGIAVSNETDKALFYHLKCEFLVWYYSVISPPIRVLLGMADCPKSCLALLLSIVKGGHFAHDVS